MSRGYIWLDTKFERQVVTSSISKQGKEVLTKIDESITRKLVVFRTWNTEFTTPEVLPFLAMLAVDVGCHNVPLQCK